MCEWVIVYLCRGICNFLHDFIGKLIRSIPSPVLIDPRLCQFSNLIFWAKYLSQTFIYNTVRLHSRSAFVNLQKNYRVAERDVLKALDRRVEYHRAGGRVVCDNLIVEKIEKTRLLASSCASYNSAVCVHAVLYTVMRLHRNGPRLTRNRTFFLTGLLAFTWTTPLASVWCDAALFTISDSIECRM